MTGIASKILCWFGFHEWESYGGTVELDTGPMTIIWWQCKKCAESKIKCIVR